MSVIYEIEGWDPGSLDVDDVEPDASRQVDVYEQDESEENDFEGRLDRLLEVGLGDNLLDPEHTVHLQDAHELDGLHPVGQRVRQDRNHIDPKRRGKEVVLGNLLAVADLLAQVINKGGPELDENIRDVNDRCDPIDNEVPGLFEFRWAEAQLYGDQKR